MILARERHLLALREALLHVEAAGTQLGALELFAEELRLRLHNEGLYVDVHSGEKTMNKRIAEASKQQYNYIVVVGDKEVETASVNVRARPKRDQEHVPTVSKTRRPGLDQRRQ